MVGGAGRRVWMRRWFFIWRAFLNALSQKSHLNSRVSEWIFMCVFFKRDKIGVLNEQCGQLYNSMSILCSRHRCVCRVFQFQLRLDDEVVFGVVVVDWPIAKLVQLLLPPSFCVCGVEPETVAAAAVGTSFSHFGHRISLFSGVWHCSCNKIAARVAKRIPQLLTLHFVVMMLFRLLIPSNAWKKDEKLNKYKINKQ